MDGREGGGNKGANGRGILMQERGGKAVGEEGEDKEESRRRSKDEVINREGKILCRCLETQGWSILNGDAKGEEEELT